MILSAQCEQNIRHAQSTSVSRRVGTTWTPFHPQISTCATAHIAAATVHAARATIAAPSLLTTTSLSMVSFMAFTSPFMRESTDAPKISESRSRLWTSG